jgi:hypothetical protein
LSFWPGNLMYPSLPVLFHKSCSKLSSGFIRTSLTRLAPPN